MLTLLTVAGCQPAGGTDAPADTDANTSAVQDASPHETLPTASQPDEESAQPAAKTAGGALPDLEVITLGAGCFWCIEAVLLRIKGVEAVTSGYMGGKTKNPDYRAVCTGLTGHAEVVEVKFNPQVLPVSELLDIFFQLHDPTTLNRQGADVGTQYRSAIFYHTDAQKAAAEASLKKWNESGKFHAPIVTEITPASEFYAAEGYHQDYFNKNPGNPYCRINILPKFKKLGLLKDSD
ncbi:MAG: peptide-methionine (S)-S-oxide reductase MsrA [Planctomycetales bacterium]|nr:peptide-methionine (S)-S-oxide reductase MsrA [Planctomycetales bacterium]